MINLRSPSTFTTAILVANTVNAPNGSVDAIPQLTKVNNVTANISLEIQSNSGALLLSRLTTAQRTAPGAVWVNGMIVYDTTANGVYGYINGVWTAFAGAGVGYSPGNPTTLLEDDIHSNLFVGNFAGGTGIYTENVGIGVATMQAIIAGASGNVSLGVEALEDLTSGSSNTGIGTAALNGVQTSNNNTGLGAAAGFLARGASAGNVFVGAGAGSNFISYNSCILMGLNAEVTGNGLTNAIAIGAGAVVGSNNSFILGLSNLVGVGTGIPTADITIGANARTTSPCLGIAGTANVPIAGTVPANGFVFYSNNTGFAEVVSSNAAGTGRIMIANGTGGQGNVSQLTLAGGTVDWNSAYITTASFVYPTYLGGATFNPANAGFLYIAAQVNGTATISSTNPADDNTINVLAMNAS